MNKALHRAFVPNEELRLELANAVKSTKWNEFFAFQRQSESLLEATLDMDVNTAADYIEKMHMEYVSTLQYNNENSLSSVITIAYLSAMRYYFKQSESFRLVEVLRILFLYQNHNIRMITRLL